MQLLLTDAGLNSQEIAITMNAIEGDEMAFYGSTAYEKLFTFFRDEMPYGTQKARSGDPVVWILDRLEGEHQNIL